jgi:hypothetical protein
VEDIEIPGELMLEVNGSSSDDGATEALAKTKPWLEIT